MKNVPGYKREMYNAEPLAGGEERRLDWAFVVNKHTNRGPRKREAFLVDSIL